MSWIVRRGGYAILLRMLTPGQSAALADVPQRSFSSLMALYEDNYILMRRLVPDLASVTGALCSCVGGSPDLRLLLDERTRYTTTVTLSHRYDSIGGIQLPAVPVRVFHDARLAELRPAHGIRLQDLPDPVGERWQANQFLHRWLRYCLAQGHRFLSSQVQALDVG